MKDGYKLGTIKRLVEGKLKAFDKRHGWKTQILEDELSMNNRVRTHLFVGLTIAVKNWQKISMNVCIPYLAGYPDFDVRGNVDGSIDIDDEFVHKTATQRFILESVSKEKIATAIADTIQKYIDNIYYYDKDPRLAVNYFIANHRDVFSPSDRR